MKTPNPTITKGTYPSGAPFWLVSCTLAGNRYRRKHDTEEAANQDRVRLIRSATSGLTGQEHVALEHAVHVLRNSENADARGKDVLFAIEWFCKHFICSTRIKTMAEYYEDFVAIKRAQGRRDATITEIERILGQFVEDFAQAQAPLIRYEQIEPWIADNSDGPRSERRLFHMVKHFFGYLSGDSKMTPNPHPILKESPFKGRGVIYQDDEEADDTQIVVYSAEECERLISLSQHLNAQRMFVWLLFTGMRPQESVRFWTDPRWGWAMISEDLKFIRVPKAVSKTRRNRVIEVSPTLRQWLKLYREFPSLMTANWRDKYGLIRSKALPAEKMVADVPRHTLISMMIKAGKGWAEIELQMGNKKDVQMRHYASLIASQNEVDAFNGLTPEKFAHDVSEEAFRKVTYARQTKGLAQVWEKNRAVSASRSRQDRDAA